MEAEELIPLLADLKKAVDCLITACEDNRRSIYSMYETLAIHGQNIGLLCKGFKEISESEDGRNNYLSSTPKEISAKKREVDYGYK